MFSLKLAPLKMAEYVNLTEDDRPDVAKLKATHEVLSDSSKSVKEIHDDIQAIYADKNEMIKDINTPFINGNEYYTLCSDLVYNTDKTKAATERTIELLDMLISLGADINTFDTKDGKPIENRYNSSTIAWAVSKGHPLIIIHLLEKGAHMGGNDWVEWFGGHLAASDYEDVLSAIKLWKESKLIKNRGEAGGASPKSKRKTRRTRKLK
jgi:hypothetical protein